MTGDEKAPQPACLALSEKLSEARADGAGGVIRRVRLRLRAYNPPYELPLAPL
jgi:hypothetical protein